MRAVVEFLAVAAGMRGVGNTAVLKQECRAAVLRVRQEVFEERRIDIFSVKDLERCVFRSNSKSNIGCFSTVRTMINIP
ncbi:MAG TPA: hypothetical protein O0X23_03060 [Methanocorpusculum sp.]|nr:hypothetical protein [Methanocorpusculum sp.]